MPDEVLRLSGRAPSIRLVMSLSSKSIRVGLQVRQIHLCRAQAFFDVPRACKKSDSLTKVNRTSMTLLFSNEKHHFAPRKSWHEDSFRMSGLSCPCLHFGTVHKSAAALENPNSAAFISYSPVCVLLREPAAGKENVSHNRDSKCHWSK